MKEKGPSGELISAELKRIYDEDQSDRVKIDMSQSTESWKPLRQAMIENDKARIARVREIVSNKELKTGADFLHAAMIFQHGSEVSDYALAHLLALRASEMGYVHTEKEADPLWLAAAAKDRLLVTLGQPQDFGTQYTRDIQTGKSVRYAINPAIADEERKKWHVPPLSK